MANDMIPPGAIREHLHRQLVMGGYRPSWAGSSLLEDSYGLGYYQGKRVRLRLAYGPHRPTPWLDVACGPTFDRWANSDDFHVPFWPRNLLRTLWEARRIIRDRGWETFWAPRPSIDLSYIAAPFEPELWAPELWAPRPQEPEEDTSYAQ